MKSKERPVAAEPAMGRWIQRSIIAIGLLSSLYIATSVWVGWARIEDAVSSLSASGSLSIVLGLVILGVAIRACRWHYYVRRLEWGVAIVPSIMAFLASLGLTATPGKIGELVKSAILRNNHDVPLAQSSGVLVIERLTDFVAVVTFAFAGLAVFSGWSAYFVISAVLICGAVLVLGNTRLLRRPLQYLAKVQKLGAFSEGLLNLHKTTATLLRPQPLLLSVVLAIAAWSCEALALYMVAIGLLPGLPVTPWIFFSVFGLAVLVGVLSMLPGGVGGFEGTAVLLLVRLGADVSDATVITLIFRSMTLWLLTFVGLAALLFLMARYKPKSTS